jgi:putative peptidoglycan lipid II flippase
MAGVFGSGQAVDAYLVACLVPSFAADAGCGAIVPALVPKLVEIEHREGRSATIDAYLRVLRKAVVISLAAAFLIACASFFVERSVGAPLLVMSPILPLNALANTCRAALNSRRRFATPVATTVIAPVFLVVCVLLGGRDPGAWVLAAGTTLAAAAEAAILATAARREGFPVGLAGLALPRDRSTTAAIGREYAYLAATAAVAGGATFIGQSMAATLGEGGISTLNYGTRLAGVLLAIGPAALGVTILPRFSEVVAERDWKTLRRSVTRILLASISAAALFAVVLIALSAPIVRLTLQRGAFTANDTAAVAAIQTYSLTQMPFLVGTTILMRVIAALKANRVLLPLSAAILVVNTGLNYVLMTRYGVFGIALAGSLAHALMFAGLAGLLFRRGARLFQTEGQ